MMEFMDSMRRGVDRAGFEVDRLLRANRVRSQVNSLRSQVDEEMRQIGHRVFELYQQGELAHPELREHCDRIQLHQDEMAARERELEAINQEVPDFAHEEVFGTQQAAPSNCPSCGARPPEGAAYCHQCGASLQAPRQPSTPAEGPADPTGEQTRVSIDDDL
jgi:hypothetical protein